MVQFGPQVKLPKMDRQRGRDERLFGDGYSRWSPPPGAGFSTRRHTSAVSGLGRACVHFAQHRIIRSALGAPRGGPNVLVGGANVAEMLESGIALAGSSPAM